MKDKINSMEEFEEQFRSLNDTERASFSRLVNVLTNQTFVVKDKESDKDDYFFLRSHRDLFVPFFEMIDYEFVYDQFNEVFYIRTNENRNRVRLNKFETSLILILRQLYYLKKKEVTSQGKTMVTLEEIMEKVRTSQVFKDEKKISVYDSALRSLRRYKIVDFVATRIDENTTFQILPPIQIVVPQDKLEDIVSKLNALRNEDAEGGDANENPDED
ncbi:MAG: DUF4194 domain-containing protein [Bacilli bacterium]|nr:DUF4194 domain-containing protein [Bacilli bacterium]